MTIMRHISRLMYFVFTSTVGFGFITLTAVLGYYLCEIGTYIDEVHGSFYSTLYFASPIILAISYLLGEVFLDYFKSLKIREKD